MTSWCGAPAVTFTLCVEITDSAERTNQNVVKIVGSRVDETRLRALYFTRATAPWGEGPLYHHVGIYAYRRKSLDRFVGLGPSCFQEGISRFKDAARVGLGDLSAAEPKLYVSPRELGAVES